MTRKDPDVKSTSGAPGRWLTDGGSGRDARLGMEPEKEPLIKKANRS
jgi:hypothetical protein